MNTKIILFVVMSFFLSLHANAFNWKTICPTREVYYCQDVEKYAYNNSTNPPLLRGIKLGKIIGVAWRPKGSLIGNSRLSPRNAYYYIIDDGSGKPFLRQCREIDAKVK